MKLAEALALRADCQRRLSELKQRVLRNAKVQEGDSPAEDPMALLTEFGEVADELTSLIKRINKTNSSVAFEAGTLTDGLAERDVLNLRGDCYRDLANAASITQTITSKSEIRFKSAVNVKEIQKRADDYARQQRELDSKIQEMNWQVDLVD
jgi:hypothetical protein